MRIAGSDLIRTVRARGPDGRDGQRAEARLTGKDSGALRSGTIPPVQQRRKTHGRQQKTPADVGKTASAAAPSEPYAAAMAPADAGVQANPDQPESAT